MFSFSIKLYFSLPLSEKLALPANETRVGNQSFIFLKRKPIFHKMIIYIPLVMFPLGKTIHADHGKIHFLSKDILAPQVIHTVSNSSHEPYLPQKKKKIKNRHGHHHFS